MLMRLCPIIKAIRTDFRAYFIEKIFVRHSKISHKIVSKIKLELLIILGTNNVWGLVTVLLPAFAQKNILRYSFGSIFYLFIGDFYCHFTHCHSCQKGEPIQRQPSQLTLTFLYQLQKTTPFFFKN